MGPTLLLLQLDWRSLAEFLVVSVGVRVGWYIWCIHMNPDAWGVLTISTLAKAVQMLGSIDCAAVGGLE